VEETLPSSGPMKEGGIKGNICRCYPKTNV